MKIYDVAVVGAGPGGSACAITSARAGLQTLLLERSLFPRHKVCGDCLNPSCWQVLDALGLADKAAGLPHVRLRKVRFERLGGSALVNALPDTRRGEITVRRSDFDHLMLAEASAAGTTVRQAERVKLVHRIGSVWAIDTDHGSYLARTLVAADGRNSTVCRLLRIAPPLVIGRIAMQAHVPLAPEFAETVALRLLPHGYCGIAPLTDGEMNLCLVSAPRDLQAVRRWAESRFGLDPDQTTWHSIAPLARRPLKPSPADGLFLVGDAARVVEPLTGEGIFYAIATGRLAGETIASLAQETPASHGRLMADFGRAWHAIYRNRLWVNRLSRLAVTHRRLGDTLLGFAQAVPALMPLLTAKVVAR